MFEISLKKQSFKFSSSHFTIFSETKSERLHGHNYKVKVNLQVDKISQDLALAFDFNDIKPIIQKICDSWDERFLLPIKSKFLKISKNKKHTTILFNNKTYTLPDSDILELPLANITSEALAQLFAESLKQHIKIKSIKKIIVFVEESFGQGASFHLDL